MDIERLKELKQQIEGEHWGINSDDFSLLYKLLPLVDKAIARQTVKREDVQRAIEQLMCGSWQSSKDGYPITLGDKTIDIAIAALQEYQPRAKVSEGLPPENELRNGMVLAWSTELDEWQVENWGYVEGRPDDYTHWKSLPEPPKGE